MEEIFDDEEEEMIPPQTLEKLPVSDAKLPPVIREIVSNAPPSRKVACFIASVAPLCALATRVRLAYPYDPPTRKSALLLQVIIEGSQSVGKSFCADIERLITDKTLKVRDKEQRRMEQEYREKKKRRKANEKLDEEPKTTVRVIPPTISKTVLSRRSDLFERVYGEGNTLTFWMFAEELAMMTDAGKQGYSNLRTIMRTAYDLGSLFGMDFASDNSYSSISDINICALFATTPSALDDYMDKKAIEGGNVTRIIRYELCDELGADGAMFKTYTPEQLASIDRTLQKMMADTYDKEGGLQPEICLDMSWMDQKVRQWCQRKGHEASLSGSVALDVFRKRSSVSAYRVAALCYYLYGLEGLDETKARKRCQQIYLFMSEFIIFSLLSRWGKKFEELNGKRFEEQKKQPPKGIFQQLDAEFSRDLLKQLVKQNELTTPYRHFLSSWLKAGDIEAIDKDHFRKKNLNS